MTHVPFASAVIAPHVLRYLHLVAAERGHDLGPDLLRAGLVREALASSQMRVSYRQGAAVIAGAIEALGDPLLGLAVGRRQHAASWGVLGLALMTADDLLTGILVGLRYQQAAGALVQWHTEPSGGHGMALVATMRDSAPDPGLEQFMVDEAFSSVIAVARDAIGPDVCPREVHVRHQAPPSPSAGAAYAEAFGVVPRFGRGANRLVLSSRQLRQAPLRRDPWVHAEAVSAIEAAAPIDRERHELVHALEVSVAQALPRVLAIEEQARSLKVSQRTLRRRLAAFGTTYEGIVDGAREIAVRQLLIASTAPLDEIAHAVGFSDARTLRRAVIRWTGSPPSALHRPAARSLIMH